MATVGILLDHQVYRELRSGRQGNERVRLYNQAARKLGLTLLYFTLNTVNMKRKKITGYLRKNNHYVKGTKSIPSVIHNGTFPQGGVQRRIMSNLNHVSYVFNAQNRYRKYRVHALLNRSPELRQYLPDLLTPISNPTSASRCNR